MYMYIVSLHVHVCIFLYTCYILVQEYQKGSKAGKSPATTAESQKELQDELTRLKRIYGEGDLSKFPKFEFTDKAA